MCSNFDFIRLPADRSRDVIYVNLPANYGANYTAKSLTPVSTRVTIDSM